MGIFDERFPGIDWHCDRCGAYLNSQEGFDDHQVFMEMHRMWT